MAKLKTLLPLPILIGLTCACTGSGTEPTPRARLEERGVTGILGYTHEYLANVSGGLRRGGQYNGLILAGIELDLEKLAGWHGALLHIDGIYTLGESLSEFQVGDEGNVSNINYRNSLRLYEAWLQQSLGNVTLRVGQMAFDSDFAQTALGDELPAGALFVHGDFGALPTVSFNVPVPVFAISTPGILLRVDGPCGFYFQGALYDGNPGPADLGDPSPDADIRAPRNDHNTRYRISDDEGLFSVAEIGWESSEHACRLGFFHHSDEFTRFEGAPEGFERDQNYGGYLVASQRVWCEKEDQGLTLFGRAGLVPEDRNVLSHTLEAGLVFRGFLPGRDADDFGLAVSHKQYSDAFSRGETDAGLPGRGQETVLELTYVWRMEQPVTIQPVIQYIANPAGIDSASDAWVIGIRSSVEAW